MSCYVTVTPSLDEDVGKDEMACNRGEFSGDEKMPEIGSMPYSSRTPLSSNRIPVFLSTCQRCAYFDGKKTNLPCSPTL